MCFFKLFLFKISNFWLISKNKFYLVIKNMFLKNYLFKIIFKNLDKFLPIKWAKQEKIANQLSLISHIINYLSYISWYPYQIFSKNYQKIKEKTCINFKDFSSLLPSSPSHFWIPCVKISTEFQFWTKKLKL